MIGNMRIFELFSGIKPVVWHKSEDTINILMELQGFFNKIIVCFSFINIFAFC